ncbi:C4-dicarboxylate TRAP transporter substrate-binding protein [Aestuariivita sp.]|jgi:TRAP-type C4-dicarboxylate transport system substrate-binding protein|uniref:C4-dicarboxylate TRAP transporter substrate-binding protein n=1 Tax=Aestuariivita sp. TaxID=1872407 RepID=UPI00216F7D8F|nr:C4-dicarboxylate TRAP transporter substrate-binding protein [Aestuariivita sp.]MCE8009785.1 TRAP transporter substrate-binding protein DctP [Aestuariivita sp.]
MNLKHLAFAGALAATPVAALADSYSVTIAAGHPPVFRWVKMISDVFVPTVTSQMDAAGHSITFSEQYGGSLAKVGEELEAVEAGLAEIGTCQSLFDPAKLAVQNVTYYTPFTTSDLRKVSTIIDDLHANLPAMTQAYGENGVVYLGAPIVIDDYLLMTNFPVNSLDDLDGRKIAAPGAAINWLSGTGAVGVSGNLTTYYNELKTGVYDGVIVFASAALPGKLFEVAPYITKTGMGAQYAGSLCANADWYASLPDDAQTALKAGADAAQDWYVDQLEAAVTASLAAMADAGATIAEAPDSLREGWAMGMDNAARVWADQHDAQGKPASEVLSTYMNAMRDAGATPLRNWDIE